MVKRGSVPVFRNSYAPAAEAYRIIRANLQLSSSDTFKSLVVTSTTLGEGKSTTVVNLAISYAMSGCKVLIIDADMRKPSLHKSLAIDNNCGLSTLIIGENSLEESIQQCRINNLHIITSGPVPPNPAELLSSNRARNVFASLEQDFDIIIIDSPPVATASDALVLSTIASGTLLVIKHGAIKKEFVKVVVTQMNNVKANIAGVILNQVPITDMEYY